MKTLLLSLTILAVLTLLIACPEPLTKDDVIAAEDKIVPSIEIFSPGENETYYSEVDFSLNISDDAKSKGDDKGDIASISYSISNDDLRAGRIKISSGGKISKDEDYGPGDIEYDVDTGDMTFSFSTISPSVLDGMLSVTITAEDRNGNEHSEKIALYENEGPWYDFTIEDQNGLENVYLGNETVYLEGLVGNSSDSKDEATDIYRISWNISGILSAELILDEDATYEDPYDLSTRNYYNSDTGLYEYRIDGYLLDINANTFSYDPSNRSFEAPIYMKYQLESLGTVSFVMEVEDVSGHVTTENVLLTLNKVGPDLNTTKVLDDGSAGHFSTNGNADLLYCIVGQDISTLSSLSYQLKSGSDSTTPTTDGITNTGDDTFTIDISSQMGDLLGIYDAGETVNVLITAINDSEVTTQVPLLLKEDSTAPTINSGFSFESSYGDGLFANETHSLNLDFTVNENSDPWDSGSPDELSLTVELDGTAVSGIDGLSIEEGSQSHTITNAQWTGLVSSDAVIPYEIILSDRLGNTRSYTQGNFPSETVTYYEYVNASHHSTFLTYDLTADNDGSAGNSEDDWAASGEEVTLDISSSRELETPLSVTIDGQVDTATTSNDLDFTASVNGADTGTNDDGRDMSISFGFSDKAGNSYLVSDATPGMVSYDGQAPTLTNLDFTLSGKGTYGTEYLNMDILDGDRAARMNLVNYDDASLNDTLDHYTYKLDDEAVSGDMTATQINLNPLYDSAEGTLDVIIRVYDVAGNSASKTFNLTKDTIPPDIASASMVMSGQGVYNSTYLNAGLSGGTDNEQLDISGLGSAFEDIEYEFNSEGAAPLTVVGGNAVIELDHFSGKTDGDYTCYIRAYDLAGNYGSATFDFVLDQTLPNTAALDFTLSGDGFYGTRYLNEGLSSGNDNEVLTFSPVISSATIDVNFDDYDYEFKNASSVTVLSGSAQTVNTIDVDSFDAEADGDYTLTVTVHDDAGNSNAAVYTLHVDKTPPDASVVTFTLSDVAGTKQPNYLNKGMDGGDNDETMTLGNLTSTDTIGFKEYYYRIDSGSWDGPYTEASNVIDLSGFAGSYSDGSHDLWIEVFDDANNSDTDSFELILDTELPVVTVSQFKSSNGNGNYAKLGDTLYLDFSIADTTSGVDDSSYSFIFYDSTMGADGDAGEFAWSYTRLLGAPETSYDNSEIPMSITVDDLAGNTKILDYSDLTAAANVEESITYYRSALDSTNVDLTLNALHNDGAGNYFAAFNETFSIDVEPSRNLASISGTFNDETVSEGTVSSGSTVNIDDSKNDNNTESVIPFDLTFTDMAGNSWDNVSAHPDGDTLNYDSLSPVTTTLTLVLDGNGTSVGGYVNRASDSSTHLDLNGTTTDWDSNYKGFVYRDGNSGAFSDPPTSGTSETLANMGIDITDDSVASASHDLNVKLVDYAGNESTIESISFVVDTILPSATASGNGTTSLVYTFSDDHGLATTDFDLYAESGDVPVLTVDSVGTNTVTCSAAPNFTSGYNYRLNLTTLFTDTAGNSSYTNYTVNYGGTYDVSAAGLGPDSLDLTLNPDDNEDGSSGSYKQRSGRMSASGRYAESAAGSGAASAAIRSNALDEMKNARMRNLPASARAGMNRGSAVRIVNRPDLNTGLEALSRAMEQVEKNRADYEALLDVLVPDEMNTAELLAMNALLEPEIYEPITMTVSTSPLVSGAAEIELAVSTSSGGEQVDDAAAYLALKALIILTGVLLTVGFLFMMRRFRR